MELLINGESVTVPNHVTTVAKLLSHFKLDDKIMIVELNRNILNKSEHEATLLSDKDKIEIVHFVGGG